MMIAQGGVETGFERERCAYRLPLWATTKVKDELVYGRRLVSRLHGVGALLNAARPARHDLNGRRQSDGCQAAANDTTIRSPEAAAKFIKSLAWTANNMDSK